MDVLRDLFPAVRPPDLEEALALCNGDVDAAAARLLDSRPQSRSTSLPARRWAQLGGSSSSSSPAYVPQGLLLGRRAQGPSLSTAAPSQPRDPLSPVPGFLSELGALYPWVSPDVLAEVVSAVEYDVDRAEAVLADMLGGMDGDQPLGSDAEAGEGGGGGASTQGDPDATEWRREAQRHYREAKRLLKQAAAAHAAGESGKSTRLSEEARVARSRAEEANQRAADRIQVSSSVLPWFARERDRVNRPGVRGHPGTPVVAWVWLPFSSPLWGLAQRTHTRRAEWPRDHGAATFPCRRSTTAGGRSWSWTCTASSGRRPLQH